MTNIDSKPLAFSMADIVVNETLGGGAVRFVTGSLTMNDTHVGQNSCRNAPLTLHFSSN